MRTYTLLQLRPNLDMSHPEIREAKINSMEGDISLAVEHFLYEAVALIEADSLEDAFDLDCNCSRASESAVRTVDFVQRGLMKVGDVLVNNKTGIFNVCMPEGWQFHPAFSFDMPTLAGRNPNCKPF